ncbi:Carbohydrate-selective porin OprB [Methylocella silvestris BL2]|uniref:Carbohydrate-selective porin OprB n=1 Tax=Methylocella silvestris (strain DSM 15510 / CIP 108128 / LMG 27833 / NCIMB 13906 / BL2) TaxID=395965 RepID=B8ESI4_METSB|nr:Carbohydrate-selective porin OprB [Methylocella silvestris BL2]
MRVSLLSASHRRSWTRAAASAVALTIGSTGLAYAADAAAKPPEPPPPGICDAQPSITTSIAIPVAGDIKKYLCDHGINFQVNYIGEVFGNPTGGIKQGARYEQRVELGLDADLDKLAGLKGLTFHVNGYSIAGQSVTTYNLLNYSAISNIAAHPALLLFELWAEQKLFDDKVAIRIGQLAADSEFFISEFGGLYTNSTFGWPNPMAVNLPSGGPAYPFATPAVRIKYNPIDSVTLMGAVFNGDPTGAGFTGEVYQNDPSGTDFRLKDSPFVIGEGAYAYNQEKEGTGLAGTLKLGGWYHFGNFDSQHFDTNNVSLASPDSNGIAKQIRGDWGLYGILDQMVWRLPGDDPKKGVGVFARVTGAPNFQNTMNFYVDGGVNFMGLWSARPDDSFGLAVAYSEISPSARAFDQETAVFSGTYMPSRNYEVALELTYSAQIIPGFTIQPDFQYIFHPGANAANPLDPNNAPIPDAAVFGVRSVIRF